MMHNVHPRFLALAVVVVALIFGLQPMVYATDIKAGKQLGLNGLEDNLKVDEAEFDEADDLEDIDDPEDLADIELDDEDLIVTADRLKQIEKDLKKVMKRDENVDRMFELDADRNLLERGDLAKMVMMHEQLLGKADERAAEHGIDSGEEVEKRGQFIGVIKSMPAGFQGIWEIGGRAFTAGPDTQFDELEGPLQVGGCAKVDIRKGMVREIDSEAIDDCAIEDNI